MTLTKRRLTTTVSLVGSAFSKVPDNFFTDWIPDMVVLRCEDASEALRMASRRAVDDWFIQTQLPDQSGFDCIEMLQDLHASSRYFLFSPEYSDSEERRAFLRARTRYFSLPLTDLLVRQLLQPLPVQNTAESDTELRVVS